MPGSIKGSYEEGLLRHPLHRCIAGEPVSCVDHASKPTVVPGNRTFECAAGADASRLLFFTNSPLLFRPRLEWFITAHLCRRLWGQGRKGSAYPSRKAETENIIEKGSAKRVCRTRILFLATESTGLSRYLRRVYKGILWSWLKELLVSQS